MDAKFRCVLTLVVHVGGRTDIAADRLLDLFFQVVRLAAAALFATAAVFDIAKLVFFDVHSVLTVVVVELRLVIL